MINIDLVIQYASSKFYLSPPWSSRTYLSHKLHDLCQVFFLLQNLLSFGPQGNKLGEVFVIVLIKGPHVLAVADEPID